MGVAATRGPVGGWGPQPPQKFCHGSLLTGQLTSRKQVSQITKGDPPITLSKGFINLRSIGHYLKSVVI